MFVTTKTNQIPNDFDIKRFEKEADALWQSAKSGQYAWLGDKSNPFFGRVMKLMGVEYRIEDDHVVILNAQKLINYLGRPVPTPASTPRTSAQSGTERIRRAQERTNETIARLQKRIGLRS